MALFDLTQFRWLLNAGSDKCNFIVTSFLNLQLNYRRFRRHSGWEKHEIWQENWKQTTRKLLRKKLEASLAFFGELKAESSKAEKSANKRADPRCRLASRYASHSESLYLQYFAGCSPLYQQTLKGKTICRELICTVQLRNSDLNLS